MKNKILLCAGAALALCLAAAGAGYSAESWKVYMNGRFGYSVEYPNIFSKSEEPDNGDGIKFESEDGECTLTIWGGHNVLGRDGSELLEARKKNDIAHIVPGSEKSDWGGYTVAYSDDGGRDGNEHVFREYGMVNKEVHIGFIFSYPKDEEKRFAKMATRMEDSLTLPNLGGVSREQVDISVFALKSGQVYKGNTELACEVNDVPPEVKGSLRHWSVFGTDASDAVSEAETGIWFFSEEGVALTFVPLESEYEFQGIVFSPDGGSFALERGSGSRPDMFLDVYGERTKKLAEFGVPRDEIQWIDPNRLIFTRLGDIREGGSFYNLSYGIRLSVVMYDASTSEIVVLKEASDTQNYSLGEVIEGGNAVMIQEESVKSTEDWGNEEKTKYREIRVEIPAAG